MTDIARLTPETTAQDVPGWDSISHVMLLMRLEDMLGRELDAGALNGAKNLGALAQAIAAGA